MGGKKCCCGETGVCSLCSGAVPQQIQVTISGVSTSGGCSDCGIWNDTFILDIDTEGDGCVWRYTFPPGSDCDAEKILVSLEDVYGWMAFNVDLYEVTNDHVGSFFFYIELEASTTDCTEWDDMDVPYFTGEACYSSATCTVTAL